MAQMIPFQFEAHHVRVHVDDNGNPWWVVADVCEVLDLTNPSETVRRIDNQHLRKTEVLANDGKHYSSWIVDEPGLYDLIFRSNKPDAKRFRQWVFTDVLPQIRKTGRYEPQPALPQLRDPRMQMLLEAVVRMDNLEARQEAA